MPTQKMVKEIAEKNYSNQPNGMSGNEDCGQMSAWYVFTAMRFYPVNPASGDYMIGSPLYGKITLHLPNGRTFVITARKNSAENRYIQVATLNGKPLNIPLITYKQIEQGGSLEFVMGAEQSSWASQWKPKPLGEFPSVSKGAR